MSLYSYIPVGRFNLRTLNDKDADEIFILRTHPQILQFVNKKVAASKADALDFIHSINYGLHDNRWFYWAIADSLSDKLLGTICLWNFSDDKRKAEIGYEILPAFQGQKYASDAIAKVIEIAFDFLLIHEIEAWIHPLNKPSIHLVEKFCFLYKATVESEGSDEPEILNLYSLAASAYRNRQCLKY